MQVEWNETAICHQENLVPVHTAQEEFENGGFTLKMHQMFFVHTKKRIKMFSVQTTPEKFENATITGGRNA